MKSGTASMNPDTWLTRGGTTRSPIPVRTSRATANTTDAAHGLASPRRSMASTAGLSAVASRIAMTIHERMFHAR